MKDLLPLAAKIARESSNIPGLPHAEIEIAAQEALARAARAHAPAKGDFTAYAAAAMRNALRDLHERQSRHLRHHFCDLDLPGTFCSPALAALILTDKFQDHIPHYRQSQRFRRRCDMDIGRQTLNGWHHAAAGCLAHIRREFVKALPYFPEDCGVVLRAIAHIYHLENLSALTPARLAEELKAA